MPREMLLDVAAHPGGQLVPHPVGRVRKVVRERLADNEKGHCGNILCANGRLYREDAAGKRLPLKRVAQPRKNTRIRLNDDLGPMRSLPTHTQRAPIYLRFSGTMLPRQTNEILEGVSPRTRSDSSVV